MKVKKGTFVNPQLQLQNHKEINGGETTGQEEQGVLGGPGTSGRPRYCTEAQKAIEGPSHQGRRRVSRPKRVMQRGLAASVHDSARGTHISEQGVMGRYEEGVNCRCRIVKCCLSCSCWVGVVARSRHLEDIWPEREAGALTSSSLPLSSFLFLMQCFSPRRCCCKRL